MTWLVIGRLNWLACYLGATRGIRSFFPPGQPWRLVVWGACGFSFMTIPSPACSFCCCSHEKIRRATWLLTVSPPLLVQRVLPGERYAEDVRDRQRDGHVSFQLCPPSLSFALFTLSLPWKEFGILFCSTSLDARTRRPVVAFYDGHFLTRVTESIDA